MVKKFEILEHKADLKIKVFGQTKEELFENALSGMEDCMRPEIAGITEIKREVKIKSPDLPALLVDFLSEVLYLIQTNKEIYNKVRFLKFSDIELEAELSGQPVERFFEDIKAVTYHGLEIKQKESDSWEAVILFDI